MAISNIISTHPLQQSGPMIEIMCILQPQGAHTMLTKAHIILFYLCFHFFHTSVHWH